MEPPFLRSYFQTPTSSQPPQRRVPAKTTSSEPRKVVSIPVHFVDCAKKRPNAALKIQKTFRGFRVRKTVKKILELKREVDAVERKLQEREIMEVVRRDGMERLKINESLMSLLFRLDSVRGFNGEIRELRKAVIKKAIRLQELLDSLVAHEGHDRVIEEKDCEGIEEENNGECLKDSCDDSWKMCVDDSSEKMIEGVEDSAVIDDDKTLDNCGVIENLDDFDKMQVEEPGKNGGEINSDEIGDETLEKTEDVIREEPMQGEIVDVGAINSDEIGEKDGSVIGEEEPMKGEILDGGETWECVGEETEEQKSDFVEAGEEVDRREGRKESSNEEWCVVGGGGGGDDKEKERKEKLLEKMVVDNEKLMAMVADLCQKNAAQTRVICSLSQRVEQLEKAMSERLRKKKKKSNNAVIQ